MYEAQNSKIYRNSRESIVYCGITWYNKIIQVEATH